MANDARTSTIITKCNGKDKVIDFRDQLSCARIENYAMMHQPKGEDKDGKTLYPSVIPLTICDFTKGTGTGKSITVSVNLEPTVPYEWLEVCKKSLGSVSIPMKKKITRKKDDENGFETVLVNNEVNAFVHNVTATGKAVALIVSTLTQRLGKIMLGKLEKGSLEDQTQLGAMLKAAKGYFFTPEADNYMVVPYGIDYSYSQEKVIGKRKGSDGFAPVTLLTVTRTSYRTDGDASGYPWYIKICNGEAKVIDRPNGAQTYDSRTLRNKTEAFIVVSDRDMFRMCQRVVRFIETWENAMCIPLILAGEKQRQAEREQY